MPTLPTQQFTTWETQERGAMGSGMQLRLSVASLASHYQPLKSSWKLRELDDQQCPGQRERLGEVVSNKKPTCVSLVVLTRVLITFLSAKLICGWMLPPEAAPSKTAAVCVLARPLRGLGRMGPVLIKGCKDVSQPMKAFLPWP